MNLQVHSLLTTAQLMWTDIEKLNSCIETALCTLSSAGDYIATRDELSKIPASEWQTANTERTESFQKFTDIHCNILVLYNITQKIRRLFQSIGKSANVPIEPPSQTRLLDKTQEIAGVLMAAVPGGMMLDNGSGRL